MDFVIGVEVKLSGNHTCLGSDGKPHPFYDICDELKGTYPKGFKFTGWHPQCRCYAVPKLANQGEFMEHVRKMGTDGGDGSYSGEVTDMPDNFREWVKDNKDRIKQSEKRGTLPYFIKDNQSDIKDILGVKTPLTDEQKRRRSEIREIARNSLVNLPIQLPTLDKMATISNKGIKEWLNQPFEDVIAKNESLLHIITLIKDSAYCGCGVDKEMPTTKVYLFEVVINTTKGWIIVREFYDGSLRIHSISDNPKILEIIKP